MATLEFVDCRIVDSGQKGKERAQDNPNRNVLTNKITVEIPLTSSTIKVFEEILPGLKKLCDLVASEEEIKGFKVTAKSRFEPAAVQLWPPKKAREAMPDKPAIFDWSSAEMKTDPVFNINAKGEGTIRLVFATLCTSRDMSNLVPWWGADMEIVCKASQIPMPQGKATALQKANAEADKGGEVVDMNKGRNGKGKSTNKNASKGNGTPDAPTAA